jgi:hypothetical protein
MKKKIISILLIMLLAIPVFSLNVIADDDQNPSAPDIIGPCEAELGEICNYTIMSIDPQGDDVFYEVRCSDDTMSILEIGPYHSGISVTFKHCWCSFYQNSNPFYLKVRARDIDGHTSEWSIFQTNITNLDKIKARTNVDSLLLFVQRLIQRFQIFEKILNQIT